MREHTEERAAHGPGTAEPAPDFGPAAAVADAILYEGYLLYPYRRSSGKNRVRWQFGLLAPRAWIEADGPVTPVLAGSAESWRQQTECLCEATEDAVVHVRVRHLQLQQRHVERREPDGTLTPVEQLEAGDETYFPFDEAVPRERALIVPLADLLAEGARGRSFPVSSPGGEETEELPGGAGRLVRRRLPVEATATVSAEHLDGTHPAVRLRIGTENTGTAVGPRTPREEALRHSLIATHTLVGGQGLAFVSLTDPPAWAETSARACRNQHTFPVLAGEPGRTDLVLSSPIILPDHPQVAPESPGDLHDAGEIDEILSLRTMLLTDEEKREARATDPRAAEILDRVDAMPPEVLARLHGTIRSLRPSAPEAKAGEEGADEPHRPVDA
ncbi:hypothetical protein N566_13390 [Streptomycetaceae bacterium MP113-05]|nr:hypothetical protein N566_13390 [Streptomycetaceae bacterium MP113-05]